MSDYDKLICLTGMWFDRFRKHSNSTILREDNGNDEVFRAFAVHRENDAWNKYYYMEDMDKALKRGEFDI